MKSIIQKIKDISENFDYNLDDTKYSSFAGTKSIFNNFKEIFNPKNLFIAAIFITGNAQAFDSPELINKVFHESLTRQSIHYNENLPTYFENKSTIEDNKKDIVLKNELWKGNVTTLVFDDVDKDLMDDIIAESKESILLINSQNQPVYVKKYDKKSLEQKAVDNFFNGNDNYYHLIKNSGSVVEDIKNSIAEPQRKFVEDFITYHEMAHSSYEQNLSQYSNYSTIDFNIGDSLKAETHSDIASILLVSKKNNLSFNEFKDLATEIAKFRAQSIQQRADHEHNSSTAIIDLVKNLEKNEYVYTTLAQDKISSFSAFYVDQLHKTNSDVLVDKLESIGLETDITNLIEKISTVSNNITSNGGLNNLSPQDIFYFLQLQKVYFGMNPEKNKELVNSIEDKDDMFKIKYNSLMKDVTLHFKGLTEEEITIYAVHVNKSLKNIDYTTYSNLITTAVGDKFVKYYGDSVLSENFNDSEKTLKRVLKNN